jgi:hercynylcysteine S-oxide lyase
VTDGCVELSRNIEQNPDYFMRTNLYAEIDHARNVIEEQLGAAKETCVFVSNVATGINTILRNFHWTPRDVIIYSQ